MNAMNLNVISVRYKSGIDGLGSYPSGQIIFAYLIEFIILKKKECTMFILLLMYVNIMQQMIIMSQ